MTLEVFTRNFDSMPPELRRPITQRMWESGDMTERERCAAQADLGEDFYRLVAQENAPAVRVAFLLNISVPLDLAREVLLKEKRANVLGTALSRASVVHPRRPLLVDVARDRMRHSPSVALARALVEVPDLDPELNKLVIHTLVASPSALSEAREAQLLTRLRALAHADVAQVLPMAVQFEHIAALLETAEGLTQEEFSCAARRLIAATESDPDVLRWSPNYLVGRCRELAQKFLRAIMASQPDASWTWTVHELAGSAVLPQMKQELDVLATKIAEHVAELQGAPQVSLKTLIDRTSSGDLHAAQEVVRHPESNDQDALMALERIARADLRLGARLACARGIHMEFLCWFAGPLQAAQLLGPLLSEDDEHVRGQAQQALLFTVGVLHQPGTTNLPGTYLRNINALLSHAGGEGLMLLPWTSTQVLLAAHDVWVSASGILFTKACTARLTSPEHWAAFESLATHWQASTGELFDAVDGLCQDDRLDKAAS